MRKVDVYLNDTKAGELTELKPGKGYVFSYTPAFLSSDLPPVSLTLPKRSEPYESDFLFPFFANIIPEGSNRRVICRKVKIDERDIFGILSTMADKDFIGAVNIRRSRDE